MIKKIASVIAKNPTAQALLMAAPASMAMYMVRDLPGRVWNFTIKHRTLTLRVMSDMDDYRAIVQLAQKHLFHSREYTATDKFKAETGYGIHYGKYNGTYFKMDRESSSGNATNDWYRETSTLVFLTRNVIVLENFLKEAYKGRKQEELNIHTNESYGWSKLGPLSPRDWDSVIFSQKNEILDFIRKFEESEAKYLSKGIPYHAGLLLHGEPGTGKTSLIAALANKLKRSVYYLNPSQIKRESLMGLLAMSDWSSKILVIEDIDVSGAPTDRTEHEGVQLSELLNSLDGIVTPHGMITIATTNCIEALDKALLRPGRFDYVLEVGRLNEEEAQELATRFEAELPKPYHPMTGAELRNLFMKAEL